MVPEGWSKATLDELCSKTISYGIVQAGEYIDGGVPCVRVVDLAHRHPTPEHMITTTKEISNSYKKTVLCEGELMFALRGDVGLVRQVTPELVGANITRGVARIAPKKETFSADFAEAALQSPQCRLDILRRVAGSALQEISLGELRKVSLLLPPLPEQKKIAEILSTWDKAIETTEKLLANAEAQKKALMQQLLTGKRRLKGFHGEWKEVRLGDVGRILSGGTPDSTNPALWDGGIAWATPTDITKLHKKEIAQTARTISELGLAESSAKLLPAGSLLVCTRATIGELAIADTEITTNQGFKNLVPNSRNDVEFLYYLLAFNKNELKRYACGSTFLELSKKDFEKRTFFVPCIKEQRAIAEVLNSASEEVLHHTETKCELLKEKRALMQQLLTGKRRVKV